MGVLKNPFFELCLGPNLTGDSLGETYKNSHPDFLDASTKKNSKLILLIYILIKLSFVLAFFMYKKN